MTNAERAARARKHFEAATEYDHADSITGLTDFIADLLHLADVLNREAADGTEYEIGEWAAEQAIGNYREEVEEGDDEIAHRAALEIAA